VDIQYQVCQDVCSSLKFEVLTQLLLTFVHTPLSLTKYMKKQHCVACGAGDNVNN